MNSKTKICQNCKNDFIIEPDDFLFYEKIKVPPPTFCPECRMKRITIWRNEHVLYKSICDLCGKNMISMYNPQNKFKVYCDKCWWGDSWDAKKFSLSYDFNVSFFSQWLKLFKQMPLIQAWKFNNINSDFINYGTDDKNCYLSSSILYCENVSYSYAVDKSNDTVDSLFSNKLIWCYENIDSLNNYNSIFLNNCDNCIDSSFLYDCKNCQNCFMSFNLRNKKYVFKNVQYTKSEYESKVLNIKTENFSILHKLLLEFNEMKEKKSIRKYIRAINIIECSGNNIENSKNIHNSFNVYNSENCKHVARIFNCKDCADLFGAVQTELAYSGVAPSFQGSDAQFCVTNNGSHNIKYSSLCISCHDLFGCVGLKNKSYCILNKQYTREQYEELVPKIIKHMNDMPYVDKMGRVYKYGEFFPSELSPFCYNETIAQEYFPLTKEQAISQGYKWKEKEKRNYQIDIKNKDIPDNIKDITDDILGKVIECSHSADNQHPANCGASCTEAFKIIPEELQFYQRMNLPLPRLCPNCRHYERLSQRNPLKLWHRKCMKKGCHNEFETSYAPERPEIIYCEKCYQNEVY